MKWSCLSISFLLVLCLTFFGENLWSFDDSRDIKFEKRLHQIYLTDYYTPMSPEKWSELMGQVDVADYTVRKGDTLWGLSTVFFGEGSYWSKIWSLNETITNPHKIYPGAKVQFFSGSMIEAPVVELSGKSSLAEDIQAGDAESLLESEVGQEKIKAALDGELYEGGPLIPPPRYKGVPVPPWLPNSFKEKKYVNKYDEAGISYDLRPPLRLNPYITSHSFVSQGTEENIPHIGRVTETEEGSDTVGLGGQIYFKSQEDLSEGEVLRIIGSDFSLRMGKVSGVSVQNMGVVQVTDRLGGGRFRGIIIMALLPVRVGALVTRSQFAKYILGGGEPRTENFPILGGAMVSGRVLYGFGTIVYLGAGKNQGVAVGNLFGVYKNRKTRYKSAIEPSSPRSIARLKVIQVEDDISTAAMIVSREEVRPGDVTGAIQGRLITVLGPKGNSELFKSGDDDSIFGSDSSSENLVEDSEDETLEDDDVGESDLETDEALDDSDDDEFDDGDESFDDTEADEDTGESDEDFQEESFADEEESLEDSSDDVEALDSALSEEELL